MKELVNIIATGSKGNAVLYHNCILVDIGVPYTLIEPYKSQIAIVLLTHQHLDHININTLKRLQFERPALRVGCCSYMIEHLTGIKNIDIYSFGKWYNYGAFKIACGKLYHDTPNCFYRIENGGHKTIHATDTAHMEGISAKYYDLFCIESNYDTDTITRTISEKQKSGGFIHEIGAINSHLSEQQCNDFFYANRKETSELIRLHFTKK